MFKRMKFKVVPRKDYPKPIEQLYDYEVGKRISLVKLKNYTIKLKRFNVTGKHVSKYLFTSIRNEDED